MICLHTEKDEIMTDDPATDNEWNDTPGWCRDSFVTQGKYRAGASNFDGMPAKWPGDDVGLQTVGLIT
jgi:hypothetical protein